MGEKNATDLLDEFKKVYLLGNVLYSSDNNTLSELVEDDRTNIKKNSNELVGKITEQANLKISDTDKITKLDTYYNELKVDNDNDDDKFSLEGDTNDIDVPKTSDIKNAIQNCKTIQTEYLLVHMKNIFVLYKLDKIYKFMEEVNKIISDINIDNNCIENLQDQILSKQSLSEEFADLSVILNRIKTETETETNIKQIENTSNKFKTQKTGGAVTSLKDFIDQMKHEIEKSLTYMKGQLNTYDSLKKDFGSDNNYSKMMDLLQENTFNETKINDGIKLLFREKKDKSIDDIKNILTRCYALGELYFVKHDLFIVLVNQYKLFLKAAIYIFRIAVLMLEISEKFKCEKLESIKSLIKRFESISLVDKLPGVKLNQRGGGDVIKSLYEQMNILLNKFVSEPNTYNDIDSETIIDANEIIKTKNELIQAVIKYINDRIPNYNSNSNSNT
jgi:hypothetical protein